MNSENATQFAIIIFAFLMFAGIIIYFLSFYMLQGNKSPEYKKIVELLKKGRNIFITGGAGTGKSFILKQLVKDFPQLKFNITSTTGVSAINIDGVTIHSWSGVGIGNSSADLLANRISNNDVSLKKIQDCRMLAIDEISMLKDDMFELLDEVFKLVRGNGEPFGGIQLVLIGDFCQLPPVVKNEIDTKNKHFCFKSDVWKKLQIETVVLTKIWRQNEKEFAQMLNHLRFAKNKNVAAVFFKDCIGSKNKNLTDIIHIFPFRERVKNHNKARLKECKKEAFEFKSSDFYADIDFVNEKRVLVPNQREVTKKETIRLDEETKVEKEFVFKVGCRVMLTKNIAVESGFANGSLGNIESVYENDKKETLVRVKFDKSGTLDLKKEIFELSYSVDEVLVRKQYPLILAYAITIHKSQGLSFDNAVVDYSYSKSCGQAYVALSRVRTKKGLTILNNFNGNYIFADNDVIDFYKHLM